MTSVAKQRVRLDYADAFSETLVQNLSGVAVDGDFLWTVSDEGRTLECLRAQNDGYVLARQYRIDDLIRDWPGAPDGEEEGAELDLEAVDVARGAVWLCGSHCKVRREPAAEGELSPEIRSRPSRRLLASIDIKADGFSLGKATAAPTKGSRSIRGALAEDGYLRPFIDLPSKENGFDIEGLAVTEDEVLLGLRGPILDNIAVVVHLKLNKGREVKDYRLSFLDLGGLAIRDLCRDGKAMFMIAGPVGDASGPFRLHRWEPERTALIQHPAQVYQWPAGPEKPEGLCILERGGKQGFLVVYDRPGSTRIQGSAYHADLLTFA